MSVSTASIDQACERVLTEREAADVLRLSLRTLQAYRLDPTLRGDGPSFVRLSARRIGYLPTDLRAWLESRRRMSPSDAGDGR